MDSGFALKRLDARRLAAALCGGAMLAGVGVAHAVAYATVSTVKGGAFVLNDEGNVPAAEGLPLAEGDRVIVLEGAQASLKFADGCVHRVAASTVALLRGKSPCRGGTVETRGIGPTVALAEGGGGAFAGAPAWLTPAVIAGAAVIAIGTVAIVANNDDDNQQQISP